MEITHVSTQYGKLIYVIEIDRLIGGMVNVDANYVVSKRFFLESSLIVM